MYVAMQLTDSQTDSREMLIFHYFKAITNGVVTLPRRSFLWESQSRLTVHIKRHFVYAHNKTAVFLMPIITKLTNSKHLHVHSSSAEFHPNRRIKC